MWLSVDGIIRAGSTLNAKAYFNDPGVNDTFTATWKWGDGTSSVSAASANTVTGSHSYIKAGIYFVTLTIKDKDGGTAQVKSIVVVLPKK